MVPFDTCEQLLRKDVDECLGAACTGSIGTYSSYHLPAVALPSLTSRDPDSSTKMGTAYHFLVLTSAHWRLAFANMSSQ
jgi:hypothetical protein